MAGRGNTQATGNLPEGMTSFVGRRRELAAVRQRMSQARLVTLVGPGGVGKTRLALQSGSDARKAFADGVWMVDLASLADASRVPQTVMAALGVRDQSRRSAGERLLAHLRSRQLLIVLDNCEHLLDASAALVAELLRGAPGLRVLATSREPLGVDGEHLFAVPPLSTPDPSSTPSPADLASYEAVALLVDRARAVREDFAVDARNHEAIARLCAHLDGLPLAIELAATRLRSLAVEEVASRLDDRFRLLTGGSRTALERHQTLRAMVDWSFQLCTPQERLLWARLSVFAGGFDLAAVEGVCADGELPAAFDVLDHLVAKSIVVAEAGDHGQRYRLLVTVRDYGAELLRERGEQEQLARRHRDHYLAQAQAMVDAWAGPDQDAWLARMRADHPNLRAALAWSLATPGEALAGTALAVALRWHWVVGGFMSEGARWLEQALELEPAPSLEHGHALWVLAWIHLVQGDRERGAAILDACAVLGEQLGELSLGAHTAQWRGIHALFANDVDEAVAWLERAVAAHGVTGDAASGIFALFQLGMSRAYTSDLARARATCEEALARSDRYGERWARAYVWWTLGAVAWRTGEFGAARAAALEALAVQRDFGDPICSALSTDLLAWCAAAQGAHEHAARLLGAAQAIWGSIDTAAAAFGPMGRDSEACAARARRALGERRFSALAAETSGLSVPAAVAFAIDGTTGAPAAAHDGALPLSRRELEVAQLIADGHSNRAIAELLVLSVRTIDGHVERILAKLGFSSRTQIAAWVVEHGLARQMG